MRGLVLIKGAMVIDPLIRGQRKIDILLEDGRIFWLGTDNPPIPSGAEHQVIEAEGLIACPGFIDLHCHLREPGFEDKETIETGSKAALAGGFTTICAMPDTNPPADDEAILGYVREKASQAGGARVLPIACTTKGREGRKLVDMERLSNAGAVAFSDDGKPVRDPFLLRLALEYSSELDRPIFEHCLEEELSGDMNEGWVSIRLGLRGSPPQAEEIAVGRALALAELTGGRLHILHLSTRGALELLLRAKEKGLKVTAEVTPHHLTLTEEAVLGYNTMAKVNPPLRTAKDAESLLLALKDGIIDAIATDHAPHCETDKFVEFDKALPGISGLETALPALLEIVRQGKISLLTLIERLTVGPAKVLGLPAPSIKEGQIADLILFDPNFEWEVKPESLLSKGKNNPWLGKKVKGKVMAAFVDGKLSYLHPNAKIRGVVA